MEASTSKAPKKARPSGRKWLLLGILAVLLVFAGGTLLLAGAGGGADLLADVVKTVVTRGELVVSVVETGEINAEKRTTIANNLRWDAIIAERVDEGTQVEVGDVIIRFECQSLLDSITRTELEVTSAENDYQQALERIELTNKEWDNRIAQAEAAVTNARNDQLKFTEHERDQRLAEAEARLALEQQELVLAEGKLKFMRDVNGTEGLEGTYSQSTIDAEQLRVDQYNLNVSNARAELDKLKKYELPQEEKRLELSLQDAELELERAKLESTAQRRLAQVNMEAKSSALEMQERQLEELHAQRDMLEIRATAPGLIIYDSGNRWDPPDVSVGTLIRSRRRLMRIPDMSTLRVYSKVFEGVSEKVHIGMPATIRLDSRGGEVLTGTVGHVALLASTEDQRYNPSVKTFPIESLLDNPPRDLKPGSSAQVELILARLPGVLKTKIAAVFTEQEQTYVWKVEGKQAVRTPVRVGEMSDTEVQILEGLAEGDVLLMAPPPDEVADRTTHAFDTPEELSGDRSAQEQPGRPAAAVAAPQPATADDAENDAPASPPREGRRPEGQPPQGPRGEGQRPEGQRPGGPRGGGPAGGGRQAPAGD
ncbi:MAG: HlyD family efflux transporter periplasmic adaptor subunit [Planctomycetes bacterium]|nr:HlyD family efflux transporter periplasmic adaptor subunit [Planctomycetota bacterium]